MLYKYMFSRVYYFYLHVFREEQIPHYFSCCVLAVILTSNIVIVSDLILYFYVPQHLYLGGYYKFLALLVLAVLFFLICRGNAYLKILKLDSALSKKKKNVLAVASILYILVSIVGVSWIAEVIRDSY